MISLAARDIRHSWGKYVLTGLGLGLPQTRARLELIYAGRASMHSKRTQDGGQHRYEVEIRMPLHMPESATA